jgi:hypothetical protein
LRRGSLAPRIRHFHHAQIDLRLIPERVLCSKLGGMKLLGKTLSGAAVGAYLLRQRKRADAGRPAREEAKAGRGRSAEKPSEIPKAGWKDILWRTKEAIGKDNLSMIAAGVAFYVFFGLIPALAALVAIYGLVADPASIQQQLSSMQGMLPGDVVQLLTEQMTRISQNSTGATWGAALGILLALWSGSKATRGLIVALNIAFGEKECRGFVRLYLISLGLTLAGVAGVMYCAGHYWLRLPCSGWPSFIATLRIAIQRSGVG